LFQILKRSLKHHIICRIKRDWWRCRLSRARARPNRVFFLYFSTLEQDLYRNIVHSRLQNTNNLLFLQNYVCRLFISFTIVQSCRISRMCSYVQKYSCYAREFSLCFLPLINIELVEKMRLRESLSWIKFMSKNRSDPLRINFRRHKQQEICEGHRLADVLGIESWTPREHRSLIREKGVFSMAWRASAGHLNAHSIATLLLPRLFSI